jgi:uncharacterized protein (DUF1800 family)
MRFLSLSRLAVLLPFTTALIVSAQSPTQNKSTHHKAQPSHAAAHAPEPLPPLDQQQRAVQLLDRFTFGARPGDIDAVLKMGPDAWFERQLNPQSMPDPACDRRMSEFPSLYLAPSDLLVQFPSDQIIRQTANGKRPMPTDPALASVYEVLTMKINRGEAEQKAKQAMGNAAPEMTDAQKKEQRQQWQLQAQGIADQVLSNPKDQRMPAILKLPVDQRALLAEFVPEPQKTLLLNDLNPRQKEVFALMGGGVDGIRIIDSELQQAKVLRAVLSERQLLEVMTDFWFNHFNVDIRKQAAQWYTPTYERDAIRAHALGKFSDLLLATAQHPAMLFYLDNWSSIGPDSIAAGKPNKKQAQKGLNENYGREVMELHTVGVDGGYTQADVTNLAKIFTGWTIDNPQQGGGFVFDPRKHEPGTVKWFGQTMQDNGYLEGQQALLWLAAQPQTAHFISYKLAQRFVADDPPPALVDSMAKTYLATGGDIKEILRTMVHSPEFNSQKYYRNQLKTPLEFVASVFRSTDTNPSNPMAVVQVIARMGEPLYQMQPPTGYPTTADHWMNSGALVDRLNFSMQFANSKVGGIHFDGPRLLAEGILAKPAAPPSSLHSGGRAESIAMTAAGLPSGQDEALRLMEGMLIGSQVSEKTNAVIRRELSGAATPDMAAGAASSSGQNTAMGSSPGDSMQPGMQSGMQQPSVAQPSPGPSNAVQSRAQNSPQTLADPTQALDTMTALILGSPEFQMH